MNFEKLRANCIMYSTANFSNQQFGENLFQLRDQIGLYSDELLNFAKTGELSALDLHVSHMCIAFAFVFDFLIFSEVMKFFDLVEYLTALAESDLNEVQITCLDFWTSFSQHLIKRYSSSADLVNAISKLRFRLTRFPVVYNNMYQCELDFPRI